MVDIPDVKWGDSWLMTVLIFLVVFGAGVAISAAVNQALLFLFHQAFAPDAWAYVRVCIHPSFAAAIEPFTSKLLPAAGLTYYAQQTDERELLRTQALQYGLLGGFSVGIVEAVSKMFGQIALIINSLPPILMHIVTGGILATLVFRYAGDEDKWRTGTFIVLGYASAFLIHYIWNTQIAFLYLGTNPC